MESTIATLETELCAIKRDQIESEKSSQRMIQKLQQQLTQLESQIRDLQSDIRRLNDPRRRVIGRV